MRSRVLAVGAVAAVLVVMAVGSPGSAAVPQQAVAARSGWGPVATLSGPLEVRDGVARPSVAVTPTGTVVVVWSSRGNVMAALRRPGHDWIRRSLHKGWQPVVGVDAAGNLVVAWRQAFSVRALLWTMGGGWGPSVRIARMSRQLRIVSDLHLSVGSDGTVLVSFWRGHSLPCRRCYDDSRINHMRGIAVIRPPGGPWHHPWTFAGPFNRVNGFCNRYMIPFGYCSVRPPTGVVYGSGTVMVGWTPPGYMQSGPVNVRTKPPGSPWQPRVRLTPPGQKVAAGPWLAATSWGQVTAAWWHGRIYYSRTLPAGGRWGPVEDLPRGCSLEGLGVDGTGAATILCRTHRGMVTYTRPRWGSWGERTLVGGRYGAGGGGLAVDPTGEAVAAWSGRSGVLASWRDSSQPWPRAVALEGGREPLVIVAIGEDDTAAVVWYRFRGQGMSHLVLRASVHPG